MSSRPLWNRAGDPIPEKQGKERVGDREEGQEIREKEGREGKGEVRRKGRGKTVEEERVERRRREEEEERMRGREAVI